MQGQAGGRVQGWKGSMMIGDKGEKLGGWEGRRVQGCPSYSCAPCALACTPQTHVPCVFKL